LPWTSRARARARPEIEDEMLVLTGVSFGFDWGLGYEPDRRFTGGMP
jgi:hypothetical protein